MAAGHENERDRHYREMQDREPTALDKALRNDALYAALVAIVFALTHIFVTANTVTTPIHVPPVGNEVVALFPAILETMVIAAAMWRLGSMAGFAIVFSTFGLGYAAHPTAGLFATSFGKMCAVAAAALMLRFSENWHPIKIYVLVIGPALFVDTFGFAFVYGGLRGIREIAPASLSIKLMFFVGIGLVMAARPPRVRT